jgi:hypothetical protein
MLMQNYQGFFRWSKLTGRVTSVTQFGVNGHSGENVPLIEAYVHAFTYSTVDTVNPAITADGSTLFLADGAKYLRYAGTDGIVRKIPTEDPDTPARGDIVADADGNLYATDGSAVYRWNAADNWQTRDLLFQAGKRLSGMAIHTDGLLAVSDLDDHSVTLFNIHHPEANVTIIPPSSFRFISNSMGITYDAKGRLFVVGQLASGGGCIYCVDGAGVHTIAGDPSSAPGWSPGQGTPVVGNTPVAARLVMLYGTTFAKAAPDGSIVFPNLQGWVQNDTVGIFRIQPV